MNTALLIRRGVVGVTLLAAAALAYRTLYANPRGGLMRRLDSARLANSALEKDMAESRRIGEELRERAKTTLAATADQADARFRAALTDLANNAGLTIKLIDTKKPVEVANPGGSTRSLTSPPGLKTVLRQQRDFSVIAGSLEASGTLEAVLRATSMVQAQPWIHRVDSFVLKPEGRDRTLFTLKIGVETILLADLAPRDLPEPQVRLVDASAQWAGIVQKNIFREPAAEAAAAPQPTPDAGGPQAPPYNEWRLTGVVESRLGVEAWLVNVRSGEKRTLATGAQVVDATFVSGAGERAVFEIGGQQYEVLNGQTLEQRRPAVR